MNKIGFKDLVNEAKIAYYLFRYRHEGNPLKRARFLALSTRYLILRPQVLWESYKENGVR